MAKRITQPMSERDRDREEVAYYEGHDADLPTNENEPPSREKSPRASAEKRDPEKVSDLEAGVARSTSTNQIAVEVREAHPVDPNVVSWDGPNDPENPMNWPSKLKWGNIAVVSAITFITYVRLVFYFDFS